MILKDTKTELTLVTTEYNCTESVQILRCHLLYLTFYLGFTIWIPLREIVRNWSHIAQNCAELLGIAWSLQGSQLRESKIHWG